MAALLAKFSPERGFLDADVERAVSDACACDARPFFDRYVRATGALDFDRWLGVLGLRSTVSWAPARSADSLPAPDLRLSAYAVPGDSALRLKLWFPGTRWGRAGFHTGDRLDSLNSVAMRDPEQFRPALSQLHVGDTVRLVAWRGSVNLTRTVTIAGFDRPTVRLVPRSDATDAERRRLAQWMAAR